MLLRQMMERIIRLERTVKSIAVYGYNGIVAHRTTNGTALGLAGYINGSIQNFCWAVVQENLTASGGSDDPDDTGKISVKLLNSAGSAWGPAFDVWVFWDRRTSFTAADYKRADYDTLDSGDKVLICKDQHGAWYLVSPILIKVGTCT